MFPPILQGWVMLKNKMINSSINMALITTALVLLPVSVSAKGNAQVGKEKAATCEACHGKTGQSLDPNYPNLAGQHQNYLVKALSDYRSGKRTNAIMASFSSQLSNQDIQDLAKWYSTQHGLEDLSIK
jgi:cytochrome c553